MAGVRAGHIITTGDLTLLLATLLSNAQQNTVATNQNTSTTASYVDLTTVGPAVTVTSVGTFALVLWSANMFSGDATVRGGYCDFAISGATTRSAADTTALKATGTNAGTGFRSIQAALVSITPGSNTYTLKYKCSSGPFAFQDRWIAVIAP